MGDVGLGCLVRPTASARPDLGAEKAVMYRATDAAAWENRAKSSLSFWYTP